MSKELDDAYFRSNQCTYYEPLLSKLVDCVDLLEERIKGLLGANVYVGDTDTLPAGSEATVSASKHGYDTMLEFGIPRGKDGSDATATDVRIAGKSITSDGVADIPLSKYNTPGVCGIGIGLLVSNTGTVSILGPNNEEVTERRQNMAVTCEKIDYAVKAAMCDGKGAAWTTDEQSAARERMNAADANKVYIMQKQIENLQGIAATEETDTTEAYTKTVPTGAQKWASLDKVGGKTVVWNSQAFSGRVGSVLGVAFSVVEDGKKWHVSGTPTSSTSFTAITVYAFVAEHVYMVDSRTNIPIKSVTGVTGNGSVITTARTSMSVGFLLEQGTQYDFDYEPLVVDLTQMFGSGNEPTDISDPRIDMIRRIAETRPEYNPGELMSAEVVEVESKGTFLIPAEVREMCPGYGWSAGTVCNEIDFERKVYVQRVKSVDLGVMNWVRYSNGSMQAYAPSYPHVSNSYDLVANCTCSKYVATSAKVIESSSPVDKTVALGGNSKTFVVYDSDYTDANAFKAAMHGVMLYYDLAEPIEVDLSDVLPDDHFIEVEAGGTVTFKQASTQLPVPSSVTYQISTSEVIANA